MYDKKAFLATLKFETKVIIHLASLLQSEQLSYRPTAKQRSTTELLQYLTIMGTAATLFATTNAWDHWDALAEKSKTVTLASFPKAMQAQLKAITKVIAPFNDAVLKRKKANSFTCGKTTLGSALIEMVLKQTVAYRMQLFLYAKASGLPHLTTDDCWRGKSSKAAKG